MSKALAGKHAVVTGGGRGIGAVIAQALAEHGATLTLMGRNADRLRQQAAMLPDAYAVPVDITQVEPVINAFARAEELGGDIDILINNAGAGESASFFKTGLSLWQRMLDINLTAPYLCTRAVVPGMVQRRWGRVVNIASTAGLKGYAYVTAYAAAKHGVVGLTRSLAVELAHTGVTVNAVCPSYTDTELVWHSIANIVHKTGRTPEQALAELVRHNPQGRLVKPEEVANAVVWLCLPGSEAITGQAIAVSGGEVM